MSVSLPRVADDALSAAKKAGATEAEAFLQSNRELTVQVRDGSAESVKQADQRGLGLRVLVEGRAALVWTSDFRKDALDDLAERAVALARRSPPDDANALADPAPLTAPVELHDDAVAALGPDDLIARATAAEAAARAFDARIKKTEGAGASRADAEICLKNSHGTDRHYPASSVSVFLQVLADDADSKQRAGAEGSTQRFLADLTPSEEIGREAARRAVRMIGAKKVPTEKLPVVMHRDVAAGWMRSIFTAFSGSRSSRRLPISRTRRDRRSRRRS